MLVPDGHLRRGGAQHVCCRRCRSRLLPLLLLRYCSHCCGDLALLLLGSRDRRGDMLPLLLVRRRRRCQLLLTRQFVLCSEELLLRELLSRHLQVCRSKVRLLGQHCLLRGGQRQPVVPVPSHQCLLGGGRRRAVVPVPSHHCWLRGGSGTVAVGPPHDYSLLPSECRQVRSGA